MIPVYPQYSPTTFKREDIIIVKDIDGKHKNLRKKANPNRAGKCSNN